jgi:hypothetical protein
MGAAKIGTVPNAPVCRPLVPSRDLKKVLPHLTNRVAGGNV